MYRQYKMASSSHIDLTHTLTEVLRDERSRGGEFLSCEDIEELLAGDDSGPRPSILGYPARPLVRELGHLLQTWMETKRCPVFDLPTYELLDEKSYVESRREMIEELTPQLTAFPSLWDMWSEDERRFRLREIIQTLGKRGLLDLLGMRRTVGSQDVWPPARTVLEATFSARHKPDSGSVLTVGARALAKHCHRDESSSWWGVSTGKEDEKNAYAARILATILDGATWINIHQMVHDTVIIEARQEQGYGARWSADGLQFRGFLEPQMVNGHEVGWRH